MAEAKCGGDPGACAAALKRKLDLYCAAVAKSMEAKPQESSLGYSNPQASDTSQLISQASFDDNAGSQSNPANSGTSKEQSDDDGDFEETTNPTNAKKMRRILSNRESARRSRERKQTHLNDLESQISSLTAENASLLKRLADMTLKYKDATLNNRNLIVHVGMMRTKVHIAEEAVRRLTGPNMLLLPTSDIPGSSMPLSSCASDVASADVPVQDSMWHFLLEPLQDDQIKIDLPNAIIPLKRREMCAMAASLR